MACSSLAAVSSGLSTGLGSTSIVRGESLRSSPTDGVCVSPRRPAVVTAAVATSAPAAAAAGGAGQQQRRQLEVLPLSQLRAMARSRGVSGGGSKAELISELLRATEVTAPSASASPAQPASVPQAAAAAAAAPAAEAPGLEKRLQATPLAALRAIARQKGLRGNTKEELIAALVAATPSLPSSAPIPSVSASAPSSFSSPAPVPSNGASAVFAPARSAATTPKPSTTTLVADALVSAPLNIPFQSEVGSTLTPVQAAQLQAELASLREAMAALQADQKVVTDDKEGLREQASFLRNLLIGGLGLAVVPLLLPAQVATTVATGGAVAGGAGGGVAQVPPPPQEPAPEVRQLSPEDFCSTLPANLLSPQAARFCTAVNQMGL